MACLTLSLSSLLKKDSGGAGFDNSDGELELYNIGTLDAATKAPSLLVSIKATARFASILWTKTTNDSAFPLGLILGGMTDGAVLIWDPHRLLQQKEDQALLASLTLESAVTAMSTSSLEPNQLCAGTSNGQVAIIDLTDPTHPTSSAPGPTSNNKTPAAITATAWNTQVPHIVATAAVDGTVTVWGLEITQDLVSHASRTSSSSSSTSGRFALESRSRPAPAHSLGR